MGKFILKTMVYVWCLDVAACVVESTVAAIKRAHYRKIQKNYYKGHRIVKARYKVIKKGVVA